MQSGAEGRAWSALGGRREMGSRKGSAVPRPGVMSGDGINGRDGRSQQFLAQTAHGHGPRVLFEMVLYYLVIILLEDRRCRVIRATT